MTCKRLLLALSLSLLAACAHQPRQNVMLTDASDCPVSLTAGQHLTLSLPSNPTTGFRWQVQSPVGEALQSLGPEVFSTPESLNMVGSAGQSTWRYQARQAGSSHLVMVYQQPWAPEVPPEKTFDCVITVK